MSRRLYLPFVLTAAMVAGCGSPEKYKKSDSGQDTMQTEGVVSLRLGEESTNWAHGLAGALHGARLRFDTGDTAGAYITVDSLITISKAGLDSIPYGDDRRKVLLLLVTDLYTQAVTWDEMRGDKKGAEARTEDFRLLAERLQKQKDSIEADTL